MTGKQHLTDKMHTSLLLGAPDAVTVLKQRIRFRRFGMALLTYCVIILATYVISNLGLGSLSPNQWLLYAGIAVCGNVLFAYLFLSGLNLRFKDPSLTQLQIVFSGWWGLVPLYAMPQARPILLMFFLPAFSFGMLRLNLKQYLATAALILIGYGSVLAMESRHPLPGFDFRAQLFLFSLFAIILVWISFFGSFTSGLMDQLRREKLAAQLAHAEKEKLVSELNDTLAKVKTLRGLLPICSSCKKIRDDKGYWNRIESYISQHSDLEFSHGICPDCKARLYPDLKNGATPPKDET